MNRPVEEVLGSMLSMFGPEATPDPKLVFTEEDFAPLPDGVTLEYIRPLSGGTQMLLKYGENENQKLSIIRHRGSYGHQRGLFEYWDFTQEDVMGHVTLMDVRAKIARLVPLEGEFRA